MPDIRVSGRRVGSGVCLAIIPRCRAINPHTPEIAPSMMQATPSDLQPLAEEHITCIAVRVWAGPVAHGPAARHHRPPRTTHPEPPISLLAQLACKQSRKSTAELLQVKISHRSRPCLRSTRSSSTPTTAARVSRPLISVLFFSFLLFLATAAPPLAGDVGSCQRKKTGELTRDMNTLSGAHRAHIALSELNLPFEEVIIDLDVPRTPEYLAINPRGLVPTLSFDGEIIPESGIVSQFLVDAFPSHLVPQTGTVEAALRRARINFFVDAFFSKFQSPLFRILGAKTKEEADEIGRTALAGLVKEVEPLLADAKPFFGGSDKLTLAEVRFSLSLSLSVSLCKEPESRRQRDPRLTGPDTPQVLTGSFVIRLLTLSKEDIYPEVLAKELPEKAPNFTRWAQKVSAHPSVTNIYDAEAITRATKARIAKARAAA
ncbi:hypothetical protein VTK73DRAFT_7727 [Phialemonium thermophilum]|uniref:Glutathione S-transferase n=1 Tax=Phialemonium thermophilum TaxID=223376 RepID=A0ABR3WDA1_9PEZI